MIDLSKFDELRIERFDKEGKPHVEKDMRCENQGCAECRKED